MQNGVLRTSHLQECYDFLKLYLCNPFDIESSAVLDLLKQVDVDFHDLASEEVGFRTQRPANIGIRIVSAFDEKAELLSS